jgi:hypothetical protein
MTTDKIGVNNFNFNTNVLIYAASEPNPIHDTHARNQKFNHLILLSTNTSAPSPILNLLQLVLLYSISSRSYLFDEMLHLTNSHQCPCHSFPSLVLPLYSSLSRLGQFLLSELHQALVGLESPGATQFHPPNRHWIIPVMRLHERHCYGGLSSCLSIPSPWFL